MDLVLLMLEGFRAIFGFVFLLLVPGFVLTLVFFPRMEGLGHKERIILMGILSIGVVILLVLVMDIALGIDTTPENIVLFILLFVVIALLFWLMERRYLDSRLKQRVDEIIAGDLSIIRNNILPHAVSLKRWMDRKFRYIIKKD